MTPDDDGSGSNTPLVGGGKSGPCTLVAPPSVRGGVVAFTLLHEATGQVFLCQMADFDSVSVTLEPEGMTPAAEGDVRGEVAAEARRHAAESETALEGLFEQARRERSDGSEPA